MEKLTIQLYHLGEASMDIDQKLSFIEQSMLDAYLDTSQSCQKDVGYAHADDSKIRDLIEQGRALKTDTALSIDDKRNLRVSIGKRIQLLIRHKLADQRTCKMRKILSDFQGLKQLTQAASRDTKHSIVEILDESGTVQRSRSSIAEVFAIFYEELYRARSNTPDDDVSAVRPRCHIPHFSLNELTTALKKMKLGKV